MASESKPPTETERVEALAEDFVDRYRRGERPSVTEFARGHPDLAVRIRELFPALVVMEELGSVGGASAESRPGLLDAAVANVPQQLGDYRILREVGRGGMGVVYEAVQESLGRHVALKVLPSHGLLSERDLERFRREARAAAHLHHTNIVPVFGVGEHGGTQYYAMQFIAGQGLDQVLGELKRLRNERETRNDERKTRKIEQETRNDEAEGLNDENQEQFRVSRSAFSVSSLSVSSPSERQFFRSVAQVGLQVAEALSYAHRQGIFHRDIKPSNLLLDARGTVWVTDFGLAKHEGTAELTMPGDVVGTLRYMAPERFKGHSDGRGDVYSLGITLHELLTLQPAFEAPDRAALVDRILRADPPRPRKVDPLVPRDLETIVLKAIAREPSQRYASADALAEDLRRFLADRPILARRSRLPERAWRWCRRNPALAALVGSVAVLLAVIAVGASVAAVQSRMSLKQLEGAEREKSQQLARSYINEARALRWSERAGRRQESLAALTRAAHVLRALGRFDEHAFELRNEALAALTLADLEEAETLELTRPFPEQPLRAFDRSMRRYVLTDPKGELSIRGWPGHDEQIRLPGPGFPATIATFSPDGRYLAAKYHGRVAVLVVWDLETRKPVVRCPLVDHDGQHDFSTDGTRVVIAHKDGTLRLFDLPSGEAREPIKAPGAKIVRFRPDGRTLAFSRGAAVELRNIDTDSIVAALGAPGQVFDLAWRSDGELLAAACEDSNVCLWEVPSYGQPYRGPITPPTQFRQPLHVFRGHRSQAVGVTFSPRGDLLASRSWDGTTRLWDLISFRPVVTAAHSADVRFDDAGARLAFQFEHGRVTLLKVAGAETRRVDVSDRVYTADLSPDGRHLVTTHDTGLYVWDLRAPGVRAQHTAVRHDASRFAQFDPDGRSLLVAGGEGLLRFPVLRLPGGGIRLTNPVKFEDPVGPRQEAARALEFLRAGGRLAAPRRLPFAIDGAGLSADGRRIAVSRAGGDGGSVLSLDNPALPVQFKGHPSISRVAMSPDARWLASSTWYGSGVKVWDGATGRKLADLPVEGKAFADFSPDGKWLVTSDPSTNRIWETGTWRLLHTLPREDADLPGRVAFSPDGRVLALAHTSTETRLLDPATCRELARLPSSGGPHCFSRDGATLVTDAGSSTLQVWDLRRIREQLAEMGLDWE